MKLTLGNDQHIGARDSQQDAFGFSDPSDADFVRHAGVLAVLADGMGGLERGEQASRTAVRTVLDVYARKAPDDDIPGTINQALIHANEAVSALAFGTHAGAPGTTLVAAVIRGDELHWAAVGDSSIFLWRGAALSQLNTPHVYARALDLAVTAGALSGAAANADHQRQALTSYLGIGAQLEIDRNVRPLRLQATDRVLLCTDGLSKTLNETEIAQILSKGEAQEACETLVRLTLERNHAAQDNITALLLDVAAGEEPRRKWWHWPRR